MFLEYSIHRYKVSDPDHHCFWKLDPDPHWSEKLDPDPDPHQSQNLGTFETQNGAVDTQNGGLKASGRRFASHK